MGDSDTLVDFKNVAILLKPHGRKTGSSRYYRQKEKLPDVLWGHLLVVKKLFPEAEWKGLIQNQADF
ncbi:MAG: hypothetical protein R2827_02955 [Bdellovibrionales bacterium]